MKMKVFITGITGFVGSHMVDYLLSLDQKIDIFGLSRWRSPQENIKHCMDKIKIVHGDLLDFSSLYQHLSVIKPDVIIAFAAQSYVAYSFIAPASTIDTNCVGNCNLLEAIKTLKHQDGFDPIIIVVSSSEVYGQVKESEIPITEENPFRPASPYAVSKVCEDMLALQYYLSWKMKIIRTRLFSHEGARRGEVFAPSAFAKQIAEIEKKSKPPIIYVGNLDSVRTFMDVRDAVRAYWMLVNSPVPGEVYNVGGSECMTIGDMLKLLLSLSTVKDIEIKVDQARLRPSDVTLQIPDTSKFKRLTGWEPRIPFRTTMSDLLNYWRERV